MQLIFFRHGIAEEHAEGLDDADRALAPRGRQRTEAAARGLAFFLETPGVVLTSPKRRARETAAIVASVFDAPVREDSVLADGTANAVLRSLDQQPEDRVLYVGHEPTMSAVVELLVAGRVLGGVELKKAAVALVETPDDRARRGHGVLRALLPPRVLRALADID